MTHNWAELYSAKTIQRWHLPEYQHLNPDYGEFRAPLLRWSELDASIQDADNLAMLVICCDVLVLDKTPTLRCPTFIFARVIEVGAKAELIFDLSDGTKLSSIITAQRIVDAATGVPATMTLATVSLDAGGDLVEAETHIVADGSTTAYVMERGEERATKAAASAAALDFLAPGEPLAVMLTTTFQIACLLSTEEPRLAADQVMWVAALTAQHPTSHMLSSDCHALYKTLIQLMDIGADALLVPHLDHEIYAEKSKACLALLHQRVQRYDALVEKARTDEHWRDQVAITIADKQNEVELAANLRAQTEATCEQMRKARQIAAANLLECQTDLTDLMVDFQRGINNWQRDETIKASIEIFTGVVDLVQQVGTIVASGGTLAAIPVIDNIKMLAGMSVDLSTRAAKGDKFEDVIDISWLFEDNGDDDPPEYTAENAKEDIISYFETRKADQEAAQKEKSRQDKIKKGAADLKKAGISAGKDIKGIYDGIMRIVDIAEKAKKLEQQSEDFLVKAAAQVNTSFGAIAPIGLDVVTGGEDGWAQTELGLEEMFDKVGDMMDKLGGGRAYRLALRRMVLHGRTMSQTRLALAKANNDLADAILRERAAQASRRLYDGYLRDLSQSQARDTALRQLAFGRVLDSKRSVYLAMEAFMRAASYFTLRPIDRSVLPRITDSVDAFSEAVMTHTGTWVTSIALGRSPGPMDVWLDVDLTSATGTADAPDMVVAQGDARAKDVTNADGEDDLTSLAIMRSADGSVSVTIPTDHPRFNRWYRVRLDAVRVYADGVHSDGDLWIDIQTDGTYLDKTPSGGTARFVTQPFVRAFVYNPLDAAAMPTGDSATTGRFAEDFFKPTPFATWRFTISRQDGRKLDLRALTRLRVNLKGSVMS